MNDSKKISTSQRIKWYKSGAIPQPQLSMPIGKVDAIATNCQLKHDIISISPVNIKKSYIYKDWVVVESGKFELGQCITKIPNNSIPVDVFYNKSFNLKRQ